MKILFIIPPFLSEEKAFTHTPQVVLYLGMAYLSAFLKHEKYEVHIIDAIAEGLSKQALLKKVAEIKPAVVGLTSPTQQIYDAAVVAKEIKDMFPEIKTIIGGYHASALPEQTLKEFNSFDYLLYGEGELTLPELLAAITTDKDDILKNIKGIVYRDGNRIIVNPPRPYIDINVLPMPDFDGFNLNLYKPFYTFFNKKLLELPIMTSRGCPYNCVFCFRTNGKSVRYRNLQSVIDEIKRDIEIYHISHLLFVDETFTLSMKRADALCDELIRTGINKQITWGCETRADLVDEALLKKMKQAGCRFISYGADSGDQEILNYAEKSMKVHDIKNAVQWTKQAGIDVYTNYVIGLPYDTVDTINKTIDFAIGLDPTGLSFTILTPFPGTEVVVMAENGVGGLKILSYDWRDYGKQLGSALELEKISRKQLEKLQRKAYLKFYTNPRKIATMFKTVGLRAIISYLSYR